MPRVPCNPGLAHWGGPQPGSFRPQGRVSHHSRGTPLSAISWTSTSTLAGRIFVGFSVGGTPRYTLDDLIAIVREFREVQAPGDPSATFLAQRGIYKYKSTGQIVEEDGGQAIIIDTQDTEENTFKSQMVDIAEAIVVRMKQELVIVEIQRNGLAVMALGVVA